MDPSRSPARSNLAALFLTVLLQGCAPGSALDDAASNVCSCVVNQPYTGTTLAIGSTIATLSAPMSLAQSFVPSEAITVRGVQIKTERVSSGSSTTIPISVSIYATDSGTDSPSTTVIANAVSFSTVNAFTEQYLSFCWDATCTASVTLSGLTKYWIVITRGSNQNDISNTNYVTFAANTSAGNTATALKAKIINASPQVWSSVVGLTDISSWALAFRLGCDTTYAGCTL